MNNKAINKRTGRPPIPADERRSNNKVTVYITDRDLRALELDRLAFIQFINNHVAATIKAKSEGE